MSIMHCNNCDRDIDTDFNAEHFDECDWRSEYKEIEPGVFIK